MDRSRKIEVTSGALSAMLGLLPPFLKHGAHTFELFQSGPGLLLDALVFFVFPGLLVLVGSYLHAVLGKTSGLVILLVGGIFLALMGLIHLLGGVFYLFGLPAGIVIISQSLVAVVTMFSALVVRWPMPSN